jgi:membrane protease YdiL (CAAX protease family)
MMPTLWDLILLLLLVAYAATQLGVLAAWGVHTYYVRRGMPGLFAQRWSFLDLWVGFHLALLFTFASLAAMAAVTGFLLTVFSAQQAPLWQRAFSALDRNTPLFWAGLLCLLLAQNGALVVVAVGYTLGKYGMDLARVGLLWNWRTARKGIWWGALAFLITPLVELLSVGVLKLMLGASTFERLMNWERQNVALDALAESLQPGVLLLAFVLVVAVAAPIGEELFFRGFVFNVLRHRMKETSAVWLSAALFALLHASAKNFLPILVIGVLLARLYARTGSLWSCVMMHGTFNFLSAMAAMILGGR